jgi:hypothetical protein
MNELHTHDSTGVSKPNRFARPLVQFRIHTLFVVSLICLGIASVYRMDGFSLATGLILLFTILMFAEDIWPNLPR